MDTLPDQRGDRGSAPDPAYIAGNLRATARALEVMDPWFPITPEIRRAMVDEALALATRSSSERVRAMGIRVLVAMDAVNARREAAMVQDRATAQRTAADVLRAAMSSPAYRDQLAGLAPALAAPAAPTEPAAPIPPSDAPVAEAPPQDAPTATPEMPEAPPGAAAWVDPRGPAKGRWSAPPPDTPIDLD